VAGEGQTTGGIALADAGDESGHSVELEPLDGRRDDSVEPFRHDVEAGGDGRRAFDRLLGDEAPQQVEHVGLVCGGALTDRVVGHLRQHTAAEHRRREVRRDT
jgi:hypothetical protein